MHDAHRHEKSPPHRPSAPEGRIWTRLRCSSRRVFPRPCRRPAAFATPASSSYSALSTKVRGHRHGANG